MIRVDTREHRIEVGEQRANPQQVTVDGRRFVVFMAPGGGFCVRACDGDEQSLVYLDRAASAESAMVAGFSVPLQVKTEQAEALEAARKQASAHEGTVFPVRAPMPGRIIRVFAENGQHVEQATPLLVVEAMKMENEIQAPGPGIVQKLTIAEGMTVEAGQLLCEIDGYHPSA